MIRTWTLGAAAMAAVILLPLVADTHAAAAVAEWEVLSAGASATVATVTTAAICSGEAATCEDVYVSDGETCTTNLGRSCEEADASQIFEEWFRSATAMTTTLLDTSDARFLDDRTVLVGRDASSALVSVDVVDGDQIIVTFTQGARGDMTEPDDGTVTVRTPMIVFEPVLVRLPTPRGGREVIIRQADVST